jgi:hypothetical protein
MGGRVIPRNVRGEFNKVVAPKLRCRRPYVVELVNVIILLSITVLLSGKGNDDWPGFLVFL